ncbi:hypothetical protein [Oricola sp.]|uniref:hypothetical protein n=1 Tax=Oricola sp. TaxID=1979950 RepID=UPI0025D8D791|nr:hypothetical protein [Oricola sp.]MCI5078211.1 hypothetical protein [Oricola sp.]
MRMAEKAKTAEKHPDWPNTIRTRDELDAALEAGLKSGESDRNIDEIFKATIVRLKNG